MSALNIQTGSEQANPQGQNIQGGSGHRLPPPSPSNNQANGQNPSEKDLYRSKLGENVPKERMRQTKTRTVKLNNDQMGMTKLRLNENTVTVKEQKWITNSKENKEILEGFEDPEFQNKQIKKFSINALIKEKDLIKESNYFDESHDGSEISEIKASATTQKVDFRVAKIEGFQTFQVKTFLFDRNLNKEIPYHKRQSEAV